jgi:hypothetical protein
MSQRRLVRVAPSFFERLDELLPAERSTMGTPSRTDFLLHELSAVIDRLADDYEGVTIEVGSVPEVRVLITVGALVARMAFYCVLADDGGVDIIYLDIDKEAH